MTNKFDACRFGGVCQARAVVQRMDDTQSPRQQATLMELSSKKINLISCGHLTHISDIKLIRTDTTLDLSQKAEKGMSSPIHRPTSLYSISSSEFLVIADVG
ncbi:hypothetical protein ACS0TY_011744 [Phlomoides rotata]